jgi:hypothetical protein
MPFGIFYSGSLSCIFHLEYGSSWDDFWVTSQDMVYLAAAYTCALLFFFLPAIFILP